MFFMTYVKTHLYSCLSSYYVHSHSFFHIYNFLCEEIVILVLTGFSTIHVVKNSIFKCHCFADVNESYFPWALWCQISGMNHTVASLHYCLWCTGICFCSVCDEHFIFHSVTFIVLLTAYHNSIIMSPYKLRGLSPRANYTDRAAAAGRRSWCKLLRIEGCHVVSATDPHGR